MPRWHNFLSFFACITPHLPLQPSFNSLKFWLLLHSNIVESVYFVCTFWGKNRPVARGPVAPPKSGKRSTFGHKVGQKWGFVGGLRGWGSKSPLFGSKRSTFGGFHTSPDSILATGLQQPLKVDLIVFHECLWTDVRNQFSWKSV